MRLLPGKELHVHEGRCVVFSTCSSTSAARSPQELTVLLWFFVHLSATFAAGDQVGHLRSPSWTDAGDVLLLFQKLPARRPVLKWLWRVRIYKAQPVTCCIHWGCKAGIPASSSIKSLCDVLFAVAVLGQSRNSKRKSCVKLHPSKTAVTS